MTSYKFRFPVELNQEIFSHCNYTDLFQIQQHCPELQSLIAEHIVILQVSKAKTVIPISDSAIACPIGVDSHRVITCSEKLINGTYKEETTQVLKLRKYARRYPVLVIQLMNFDCFSGKDTLTSGGFINKVLRLLRTFKTLTRGTRPLLDRYGQVHVDVVLTDSITDLKRCSNSRKRNSNGDLVHDRSLTDRIRKDFGKVFDNGFYLFKPHFKANIQWNASQKEIIINTSPHTYSLRKRDTGEEEDRNTNSPLFTSMIGSDAVNTDISVDILQLNHSQGKPLHHRTKDISEEQLVDVLILKASFPVLQNQLQESLSSYMTSSFERISKEKCQEVQRSIESKIPTLTTDMHALVRDRLWNIDNKEDATNQSKIREIAKKQACVWMLQGLYCPTTLGTTFEKFFEHSSDENSKSPTEWILFYHRLLKYFTNLKPETLRMVRFKIVETKKHSEQRDLLQDVYRYVSQYFDCLEVANSIDTDVEVDI
ncbi:hypothetical protein WICPIJ_005536 [Wickerhamomyces pijperi]|uniref:F-box domain-containing protein n=1 Tax=Wickerhamomyces pijperi TaxID=599730 RepID=A0A9P8Q3C1_WICPI|nr:hypothetical protein WICPIJ_005536 [Wickerhamomyces pijperi]